MNIVSLIPARGGSKGVVRKNIREICGEPLISYSILDSLRTPIIEETYVSTDDNAIAKTSLKYGANVPFLRPSHLATDKSPMLDVIQHFLKWYMSCYLNPPKYIVLLLPTTPIRDTHLIEKAIDEIMKEPDCTGLRSVEEFPESPYKWFDIVDGYLYPLLADSFDDLDKPRQFVPKAYRPNGYVDILKTETVLNGSLFGNKILPFITPFSPEIDNEDGFIIAETFMKRLQV